MRVCKASWLPHCNRHAAGDAIIHNKRQRDDRAIAMLMHNRSKIWIGVRVVYFDNTTIENCTSNGVIACWSTRKGLKVGFKALRV